MIIDPLDVKGDGGHVLNTLKRLHDDCGAATYRERNVACADERQRRARIRTQPREQSAAMCEREEHATRAGADRRDTGIACGMPPLTVDRVATVPSRHSDSSPVVMPRVWPRPSDRGTTRPATIARDSCRRGCVRANRPDGCCCVQELCASASPQSWPVAPGGHSQPRSVRRGAKLSSAGNRPSHGNLWESWFSSWRQRPRSITIGPMNATSLSDVRGRR